MLCPRAAGAHAPPPPLDERLRTKASPRQLRHAPPPNARWLCAHVADGARDVAERLPALGLESKSVARRTLRRRARCGKPTAPGRAAARAAGSRRSARGAAAPAAADRHHAGHVRELQLGRAAQLFTHARRTTPRPTALVLAVAEHLDQRVARRAAVGRRRRSPCRRAARRRGRRHGRRAARMRGGWRWRADEWRCRRGGRGRASRRVAVAVRAYRSGGIARPSCGAMKPPSSAGEAGVPCRAPRYTTPSN